MKRTELILITTLSIALGTAMHFAHHLPFFNDVLRCIFPANECVWEHMKMLFYPMLLTSIYLCLKEKSIKPFGGMIASVLVCIPIQIFLFYIYWIFTHHSILIVDIIAYVAVMIFGYIMGNKFSHSEKIRSHSTMFIIISIALMVLIGVLTFIHPDINLFRPEA